MLCPICNTKCIVVDSRKPGDFIIRRRYECKKCTRRFTTYERLRDFSNAQHIPYNVYQVLKDTYTDEEIMKLNVDFIMKIYLAETYGVDYKDIERDLDIYGQLKRWKRDSGIRGFFSAKR